MRTTINILWFNMIGQQFRFASIYYNMSDEINRKTNKKRRRIAWITVLSFLFVIGVYYFQVVCPLITKLSEEKARSVSTSTISEVVGEVMTSGGLTYNDLVKITYSNDNSVETIEVNTVKVNELVRLVTKEVQNRIDNLKNDGIGIALGTFTGIPFLYGVGPEIGIKIVPIGTVNSNIFSSLSSCGINQSQHRLYFTISTRLGLILPTKTQDFITSQEVLVCESVIVGKIPTVYLGDNLI